MSEKISKHFHLTLHFTVTGDESKIPTEGINAKVWYTRSGDDKTWREGDDRMRRLYEAVLSNKDVLRIFLESRISAWLDSEATQHWDEMLFDEDVLDKHGELRLQDILRPAIAALSEEDKQVFASFVAHDAFYDNVEEFLECFSTEFDAVELSEVEMRGEQ